MKRDSEIGIGLLGLGVIGSEVARNLIRKSDAIAERAGSPLVIKKILERDLAKKRPPEVELALLTPNVEEVISNPEINIIIEVLGGESPAFEYIKEAISRGKCVVTANKEVIAKHGLELFNLALKHRVSIFYEASVGGGIPLIAPFKKDLLANDISRIWAIINGTTNYILTMMAKEGVDFPNSLKQAQNLGYAESNPENDIEGIDAAYKLAILATLAFRADVRPSNVYHEGISRLTLSDFRYAKELGYTIKLLAIAKEENNFIETRVHPTFIPENFLLANVNDVFNAVEVEGDLTGRVLFYGKGAGGVPTSSAIIADVIRAARNINLGINDSSELKLDKTKKIKSISDVETRYYLRMTVADRPNVLAQIAGILGKHSISISSVIQKEVNKEAQTAEIVVMTYSAREWAMEKALKEMENLEVVKEIGNFIRVEG